MKSYIRIEQGDTNFLMKSGLKKYKKNEIKYKTLDDLAFEIGVAPHELYIANAHTTNGKAIGWEKVLIVQARNVYSMDSRREPGYKVVGITDQYPDQ